MIKRIFKVIKHKKIIGILFLSLTAVLIASLSIISFSEAETKKGKVAKPLTSEQKKELAKEAKNDLDGTTWEITLREMASGGTKKKRKEIKDTLTFSNMRIGSKRMKNKGFEATNYSIRIKGRDNEIVVWETMQTSEAKGIAFWRGETRKDTDTMRGVLSWHLSDTKKEDYSFSGIKNEEELVVEPTAKEADEEVGGVAVEKAASGVTQTVVETPKEEERAPKAEKKEEPKKKKKRWWQR